MANDEQILARASKAKSLGSSTKGRGCRAKTIYYREPSPKEWERCVQKLYFWATVQRYSAGSLGDGGSGRPGRKEQKSALRLDNTSVGLFGATPVF